MQAAPPSRKRCAPCPPPTVARALAAVKYDAPLPAVRPLTHSRTPSARAPRPPAAACSGPRRRPSRFFAATPARQHRILAFGWVPPPLSPCRLPPSVILPPLFCPRCLIPAVPPLRLSTSPFFPPCRPVPAPVPSLCRLSLRSALPLPAPIFSPQRPGGTDIFGSSPCRPVRNHDEKRRFPSGGGDGRWRFFDAFFTRGAVSYA